MEKEKKRNEIKPLITSRVLFISVLDKIYLVFLIIMFIALSCANFAGDISSIHYGFWAKLGKEILIIILTFIIYLLLNWFYKCAVKTVLCLTENEVYKEKYVPLKRSEMSIPLNKITAVSSHKILWIFRFIIIHQYNRFPMIFFTWNNQEFKDKLNELITNDKEKIENKYEDKDLIVKDNYKYVGYALGVIVAIILLIGVIRFFCFIFSDERKIAGTYLNGTNTIVLNKDGSCDINDIVEKVTKCNWSYQKDNNDIIVDYEYKAGYYYYYDSVSQLTLDYNPKDKTIEYYGDVFKK